VSSGEMGDGMESVLELHVEIVTAGRVVCIHRVDAEVPYDGLSAALLSPCAAFCLPFFSFMYVEVDGKSIGSFLSYLVRVRVQQKHLRAAARFSHRAFRL
jgi:hypothetical protein